MEPRGRGSLLEAFEALKARLGAEGLFETARKRPIPLLPARIGIVTSPDGAALRDILRVLRRRHAGVDVLIAPARVQGEGAAEEIASAIETLGRAGGIDVLIVGRGGGSIEDLWAFNEERVARAIAASPVPVISAVGHETDVTIADFVADVRAATPSQAAELVVASREELSGRLSATRARLSGAVRLIAGEARRRYERAARHPSIAGFPAALAARGQLIDDLEARLTSSLGERLTASRSSVRELSLRLAPRHLLEVVGRRRDLLRAAERRLTGSIASFVSAARARADARAAMLRSLSPLNVLDRGYAICLDPARGAVVRAASGCLRGKRRRGAARPRKELDCRVLATRPAQEEPSRRKRIASRPVPERALPTEGPGLRGRHEAAQRDRRGARVRPAPLDESLRLFEEGVSLSRRAGDLLGQAERKIEILTKTTGGALEAEPFEEGDLDDRD